MTENVHLCACNDDFKHLLGERVTGTGACFQTLPADRYQSPGLLPYGGFMDGAQVECAL